MSSETVLVTGYLFIGALGIVVHALSIKLYTHFSLLDHSNIKDIRFVIVVYRSLLCRRNICLDRDYDLDHDSGSHL